MRENLHHAETDTSYGPIGVTWNPTTHKVQLITLKPEPRKHHQPALPIQKLLENIKRFLQGENITFDITLLQLDQCTEFQQKVLIAEYNIPRGTVSTYTRIAKHIGSPKAARAVGNALAQNPFPIAIPCHRAVRSNLIIGGYQGGTEMKKQLLQMEGINITDYRVENPKLTY